MILSEISVRRPVFAMVVSLLLTLIGLMALSRLTVRETPNVQPPVVSIDTVYRGASAPVVESKITQVIENQIAGLEGVETLRSSSFDERSRITIEFDVGSRYRVGGERRARSRIASRGSSCRTKPTSRRSPRSIPRPSP